MDNWWVPLIGSALGGGIVSGIVALWVHAATGVRARRDWSRELRLKAFSQALKSMDDDGNRLVEQVGLLAVSDWDAITTNRKVVSVRSGLFTLVATPEVEEAVRSWEGEANAFEDVVAKTAAARKLLSMAESEEQRVAIRALIDESEAHQETTDEELMDCGIRIGTTLRTATQAMRANLGLDAAKMLSDGKLSRLRRGPRQGAGE